MEVIHKIGRRKNAVARVYIAKGKGNITINKREFENYFTTGTLQYKVMQPLALTDNVKSFDITVNVHGGGTTGQAEAIRLAISRAMCELNPEHRLVLKPEGLLTRDPRMVERKKFGQKKARKKFQFSNVKILNSIGYLIKSIPNLVFKFIHIINTAVTPRAGELV